MTKMNTSFTITVTMEIPEDNLSDSWIYSQNAEQSINNKMLELIKEHQVSDGRYQSVTHYRMYANGITHTIPSGHGSSILNPAGTTFDETYNNWNNHLRLYAGQLHNLTEEQRLTIRTYGTLNRYGHYELDELSRDELVAMWSKYRDAVSHGVRELLTNKFLDSYLKDLEGKFEDGLMDEPDTVDKANDKVEDLPTLTPEQSRRAQEEYDYNNNHNHTIAFFTQPITLTLPE
jgi:hypothetical protein